MQWSVGTSEVWGGVYKCGVGRRYTSVELGVGTSVEWSVGVPVWSGV